MRKLLKKSTPSSSSVPATAEKVGVPNDAAAYFESLNDPEVIERVFCKINDGHVFKLPPRQTAGGWRGAEWNNEVWQGVVKVVERESLVVVLLLDKQTGSIFAVCPVKDGAVDRCVDSSRYFVLRVENAADGRHMFVGIAFNERNDAFDFNVALEDAKKERDGEMSNHSIHLPISTGQDYSLKEGEKLKVNVPNKTNSTRKRETTSCRTFSKLTTNSSAALLKPPKQDARRRLVEPQPFDPNMFPTTFDTKFPTTTLDNNNNSTCAEENNKNNNTVTTFTDSSFMDVGYKKFWSLFGETW